MKYRHITYVTNPVPGFVQGRGYPNQVIGQGYLFPGQDQDRSTPYPMGRIRTGVLRTPGRARTGIHLDIGQDQDGMGTLRNPEPWNRTRVLVLSGHRTGGTPSPDRIRTGKAPLSTPSPPQPATGHVMGRVVRILRSSRTVLFLFNLSNLAPVQATKNKSRFICHHFLLVMVKFLLTCCRGIHCITNSKCDFLGDDIKFLGFCSAAERSCYLEFFFYN